MNNKEKLSLMSDIIINRPSPFVRSTTAHVWGKEVLLLKALDGNNYEEERYELQNWVIRLNIGKYETVEDAGERLRMAVIEFEQEKAQGFVSPVCHMLCDWMILNDEYGRAIRSPSEEVLFVKYAIVVENEQNE